MYEIGSQVMYASSGVCNITDIREEDFSGEKRLYYVLKPVGSASHVFVPTDNEQLISRMRPLLPPEEIRSLIRSLPGTKPVWIADNHARSNHFQKVLSDSRTGELLQLTRNIYLHKQELANRGKKNLMADENVLKKAERILFGEIAAAMRIAPEEVLPFIENQLALAK